MIINCFGARGSIPVSGKQFLEFGGNTTCIEVVSENGDRVIIDGGTGIKTIGEQYLEKKIHNITILFTHYHFDHVMGLPFFKPLFIKNNKIRIIAPGYYTSHPKEIFAKIIEPPAFPITLETINGADIKIEKLEKKEFKIGSLNISSIPLSHPNGGYGYKFTENDKSFVFLTDNELNYMHNNEYSFENYVDFVKNSDLLIHDAEFLPQEYNKVKMWGHSTYDKVVELAVKGKVKQTGLFHHNQSRNDDEVRKLFNLCVESANCHSDFKETFFPVKQDDTYTI
ncbi:MAG: MBL fold metallo-hydrolase [Candidatus Muiribacteriota bacterium]